MTRIEKARRTRIAGQELDRVLRQFEPRVANAVRDAVRGVRNRATLRALSAALERGDIAGVLEIAGGPGFAAALMGQGLEPGTRSLQEEITATFREGGVAGMKQLPRAAALRATLDLNNPEAVRFIRENVPTLIREVSENTQRAVQAAVVRGFDEGRPAPMIAREIRENIGLTEKQGRAVSNFRRQLETGNLGNGKIPWERRLSATERQQARSFFRQAMDGSPVDSGRIDTLVNRYYASLVNRRAKDIARTEVHRAFIEGTEEMWRQAVEQELLIPELTRRIWIVTPDDRLRHDHSVVPSMNEGGVRLDEPFQTPIGPVMGPGQSGLASWDVNCRCAIALQINE